MCIRDRFRKALERHNLYKLAWLTETGHRRPGIPKGVPVSVLPCIREGVEMCIRDRSRESTMTT